MVPFQTDRARSAFVGFMALCAVVIVSQNQSLAPRLELFKFVEENAKPLLSASSYTLSSIRQSRRIRSTTILLQRDVGNHTSNDQPTATIYLHTFAIMTKRTKSKPSILLPFYHSAYCPPTDANTFTQRSALRGNTAPGLYTLPPQLLPTPSSLSPSLHQTQSHRTHNPSDKTA